VIPDWQDEVPDTEEFCRDVDAEREGGVAEGLLLDRTKKC